MSDLAIIMVTIIGGVTLIAVLLAAIIARLEEGEWPW